MPTINPLILKSKLDIFDSLYGEENILELRVRKMYTPKYDIGDSISNYVYGTRSFSFIKNNNIRIICEDNIVTIYSNKEDIYLMSDCNQLFSWLKNFETIDLTGIDFSTVNNIEEMFYNCKNLKHIILDKSILYNFDFEDLNTIFENCTSLEDIKIGCKNYKIN